MTLSSLLLRKQVLGTLIDTKEKTGNTDKLDVIYSRYDEICRQIADLEKELN